MRLFFSITALLMVVACSHAPNASNKTNQRKVASQECDDIADSLAKNKCLCEDADSQQGMNMCSGSTADLADETLNHVYDCLLMTSKEKDQELFKLAFKDKTSVVRKAQLAWISYKDTACNEDTFSILGEGEGSLAPTLYAGCISSQTKSRLHELIYMDEALGYGCAEMTNYKYTVKGVTKTVNIQAEVQAIKDSSKD